MVDQAQIDQWKAEYTDVFLVESNQEDYVFRPLTLGEYTAAQNIAKESGIDAEESIVRSAVLHPDLRDDVPAGVWTSLANEILEVSHFNSPKVMKQMLIDKRDEETNLVTQIKAFIIASIPTCSESELDSMTFEELIQKVILAEQIIKVQQAAAGIVGHDIQLTVVDPEEEEQKAKKAAAKHVASKAPGEAGLNDPIAAKLWAAMGKG